MSIEDSEPSEKEPGKIRRQLRTLSRCVNAFFQAETEHDLLQTFCELLVSGNDISLAWVGYHESTSEIIRPVASAGVGVDYFKNQPNSADEKTPQPNPVTEALDSGVPCCVNDIATESRFPHWRDHARKAGHASCLAIPLSTYGKRQGNIDLHGTLHICADEPGFFDEGTIQFCTEAASYLTLAVADFRTSLSAGLTSGVAALRAKQERRQAHHNLEKMRDELSRVTRLGEMGQISASIAHEINQPLAAIVTHGGAGLRWLSRPEPDIEEARIALSRIIKDGERAKEVVVGIRSMFQKGDQAKASQDINEVIGEVLVVVREKIARHQIVVRAQLEDGLPEVSANRVQLQQVIMNLVINAIEAMSSLQDRERALTLRSQPAPSGIRVTVSDTGIGIEKEKIEQVFNPFFSTKLQGIGVGLAICRSIVERHGGSLFAEHGYPHGTVFGFVLPIAEHGESSFPPARLTE